MNTSEATEALTQAERARAKALTDATAARERFEQDPSAKSHSALAVAEQVAKNSLAKVEQAREDLERVRRAELTAKLEDARTRASHRRLFDRTKEARGKLVEMFGDLCGIIAEIESAIREQHHAVQDAETIAQELGTAAAAPSKVPVSLVRALVGILIARKVYDSHAEWTIGIEPWSWLAARPEPPIASPFREMWRRARAILGETVGFLPPPRNDFSYDAAHTEFFHRRVATRPQWHEVDR